MKQKVALGMWVGMMALGAVACEVAPDEGPLAETTGTVQQRAEAETHVGAVVECGKSIGGLCAQVPGLSACPKINGEGFFACSGVPGTAGTTCEICGGLAYSAGIETNAAGAGREAGALYCWSYEWGPNGLNDWALKEHGPIVFHGAHANFKAISMSIGEYNDPNGPDGKYVTVNYQIGACQIGIIMLDWDEFGTNLGTVIEADPVADDDPVEADVGCYPGDTPLTIRQRCINYIDTIDSTEDTFFGYAKPCADFRAGLGYLPMPTTCGLWLSSCQQKSGAHCAQVQGNGGPMGEGGVAPGWNGGPMGDAGVSPWVGVDSDAGLGVSPPVVLSSDAGTL